MIVRIARREYPKLLRDVKNVSMGNPTRGNGSCKRCSEELPYLSLCIFNVNIIGAGEMIKGYG